jgi:hypothetical protein
MSKTVVFNFCNDNGGCKHLSHSGAFTPGGSKPTCDHHNACVARVVKDKWDWKNRVLAQNPDGKIVIPTWCPL